ncbi:hypothetical protein N7474_009422 [Penicillium riverlandense]|uniref:uncharacterized protein n=1 Tax=Penicillium riverlandense TaxID=1903569 RepID=UPI002546D63F|nr:uncharacterized protein N7474_009422 [Penicillium riverlandense]KAJ5808153.1 hypothetical protein N7474_009422 [Penicillium riverlandense]
MRGFLALVGLLAATTAAENSICADGLYMIAARGSTEPAEARKGYFPANSGSAGYVAQLIADKISGSKIAGVKYPATLKNPPYVQSEDDGAATMLQMAKEYHTSCPNSKMALIGYSQGAQVVSDVLCGGAGGMFNNDPPLSPAIVKENIVAAVLFGDPTHIANTSYDRGTSIHNGMFPRKNTTVCQQYDNIVASWCDKGDKYCDSGKGKKGLLIHESYLGIYNSTMVDYVVEKWKNATTTGTSTGSPTSSTTSSPSPSTGMASGLTSDQSFFLAWPLLLLCCGLLF